jgi:hypothetical protein
MHPALDETHTKKMQASFCWFSGFPQVQSIRLRRLVKARKERF